MSKNLSELSGRKGLQYNLFDQLGKLAIPNGTPAKEDLDRLAKEFLIGSANTYGTTTFYDFLKPENQAKKVYVCNGSVCMCAGTQDELRKELSVYFQEDEIGEMCCLGRCHENKAFHYNGKNYSARSSSELERIIAENEVITDQYAVKGVGKPVLTSKPPSILKNYEFVKKVLSMPEEDALKEIELSGIRGRGGAGFPLAKKLAFCKQAEGETKFIICNADEGDPGAFSDRYLLEHQPHLLLAGMIAAGYIIGASWAVIYIRAEYPESVYSMEQAIRELDEIGGVGEHIFESKFNFYFKIIKAQGSYICGEETALINSIEGQRPEVRIRPPYPAVQGLFNKPTVVNNVETICALPYILRNGGKNYGSIGTNQSKGTKLLSLDSHFNYSGIVEVEMGTPLSKVIYEAGGGFKVPVKALHIGGPLGGLVPVDKVGDLTIDFESFQDNGFLLGHASIVCIPESMPLVQYLEHLFAFAADESCGKCFPCRLGTKRAEELFFKAQHSSYKIDRTLLDDLLHALESGSLCAHGGGIPLPVRNALQYFEAELSDYIY